MKRYDNYKDSDIEWLGLIPTNWEVTKLKFIGNSIGGLTYSPNDVVEDETKGKLVLRSSNIQNGKLSLHDNVYVNLEVSEKLTLKKGDILICSRNGSQHLIGKNICIDERTEGNTFGAFMMIFRSNYYGYLNHFFNSPIFKSQSGLFLTATINQLTSSTLNNFYLALPNSIEEQTQIANYLDHKTTQIDSLISKKEQFIKLLEEERVAVINQAVTKGLDPNVPMKDSGVEWLGEIPEHWEVKRIKYCYQIFGGFAFSSSDFTTEGIQIVKIGNLYQNQLSLDRAPTFVNKEFVNSHSNFLARQGDILMSLTGTLGKRDYGYAILVNNEDVLLVNQRVALIKANESMCIEFSIKMFQCELYLNQLYKIPTGTKQGNLSCEDVLSISMAIPSKEEQFKIGEYLKRKSNEIDTIINKTQQEIELLKEYKTALISEVVTGKVDVRDV